MTSGPNVRSMTNDELRQAVSKPSAHARAFWAELDRRRKEENDAEARAAGYANYEEFLNDNA